MEDKEFIQILGILEQCDIAYTEYRNYAKQETNLDNSIRNRSYTDDEYEKSHELIKLREDSSMRLIKYRDQAIELIKTKERGLEILSRIEKKDPKHEDYKVSVLKSIIPVLKEGRIKSKEDGEIEL